MKPLKKRTFRKIKKVTIDDDALAVGLANTLGVTEAQADNFVNGLDAWRKSLLANALEEINSKNDPNPKEDELMAGSECPPDK
jgi:hypothetical protein